MAPATPATTPATTTVPADDAREAAVRALVAAGATPGDAAVQADHLVEAELRGHPAHGLTRLAVLAGRLRAGLLRSGAAPGLVWSAPGVLLVDGRDGFGPVVAHRALDELLPGAARTGVAVAALSRAHHLGMLAPYLERMVAAGCLAVVTTTSDAHVHPWGGAGKLLGTNPLGIGVPAGARPVVADLSTAATSAGRVRAAAAAGTPLAPGSAVDEDGRPTTDAAAALAGAISPLGGAKGYALALGLQALVGLATGSGYGADVRGNLDTTSPVTKGDVLVAVSARALGVSTDDGALAAYLDAVRGSGAGGAVAVPGDRARAARAERVARGIAVETSLWEQVRAMGE